jgi:hypothetical protein
MSGSIGRNYQCGSGHFMDIIAGERCEPPLPLPFPGKIIFIHISNVSLLLWGGGFAIITLEPMETPTGILHA